MKTFNMSEEEFQDHVDGMDGICLNCGEIKEGGCEPDAENYECDSCGENKVMGIEMALVEEHIEIE